MQPFVEVKGLCKAYGSAVVLRDFALSLEAGRSLAVLGRSGSGKSTLLHILGGMDTADSGSVRVAETVVTGLSEEQRNVFRGEQVGFVFQQHFLIGHLTALENVLAAAWGRGGAKRYQTRAQELLEGLGVGARMGAFPREMSGGECQRVAVARALLLGPKLVLADEPTGALDRANSVKLQGALLDAVRREGAALIAATHDLEFAVGLDGSIELCPKS